MHQSHNWRECESIEHLESHKKDVESYYNYSVQYLQNHERADPDAIEKIHKARQVRDEKLKEIDY